MTPPIVRIICPNPEDRELAYALSGDWEGVACEIVKLSDSLPPPIEGVEVLVGEQALAARLPGAVSMEAWQGSVIPTTRGWAIPSYDPGWVMDKAQWPLRWLLGAHVSQAKVLARQLAAMGGEDGRRVPAERSEAAHRPSPTLDATAILPAITAGSPMAQSDPLALLAAAGDAISPEPASWLAVCPFVLPRLVSAPEWSLLSGEAGWFGSTWVKAAVLALDVETNRDGAIDLLGLSWDGVNVWQSSDLNYDRVIIQDALDAAPTLVAHNAAFDTRALEAAGFSVPRDRMMDSIVAANMLHSDMDVGLNDAIATVLAGEWTFHKALWGFSKQWTAERAACRRVWAHWYGSGWRDDDAFVFARYNLLDVASTHRLFVRQRQLLEAR